MKIFITGVTGLIGSHLADFLINKKKLEVWGLKRFRSDTRNIRRLDKLNLVSGDMLDYSCVELLINKIKPDVIFHLASQSYPAESWSAPIYTVENNILSTINLLEVVRKLKNPPKVYLACSSAEYGITQKVPMNESHPLKPVSPFGVSKLATEALGYQYFVNYKVPVYLGRYFLQTGRGQGEIISIPNFCKRVALIEKGRQEPVIYVENLKTKRDFLDVRDGVRATWMLTQKGKPGDVYNICSGKAPLMSEVLKIITDQAKVKIKVKIDPARLRPSDEPIILGTYKKLHEDTGWKPKIPLKETILWILDYWREIP